MAELTEPRSLSKPATLRIPQSALRIWAGRGVWLGAGAWALALWALGRLATEPERTWAGVLLIGAGLLAVVAWGGVRWSRGVALTTPGERLLRFSRQRVMRLIEIAAAGGLIWAADSSFLTQPPQTFGQAGWLWVASMALLIAATVAWPSVNAERGMRNVETKPQTADANAIPADATTMSGEVAPQTADATTLPTETASPGRSDRLPPAPAVAAFRNPESAFRHWEALAFAGLVLLGLALRLWDLHDFPYAIHGDEILTGRVAMGGYMSLGGLINGQAPSVFSTLWPGIDLPALWFRLVALALKGGGISLEMLRLPAALFGAATVVPFYGLLRGLAGRAAALGGTAVLVFSAVDVHYSRVTLNNIITPFFWTVCFFFLLRGLQGRRPVDWVLAGIAAGLSEYFYYGTHLLPFILLAFGGYLLIVHGRQGWRYLGHFGLLALGYLAGFGPLLAYFNTVRPDIYFGRAASQNALMWDHIPRSWADFQTMWNTLWPLFAQNLLGFSWQGGQDTVYWGTLLFAGETAALVLGTALLIWRWRHPAAFLLLISGLGTLVVGGTLIHGVRFYAHWTPAFPAFYAAIGLAIGAWAACWRGLGGRWQIIGPALLTVALLADGLFNVDFYFNRYYIERPEFEIRAAQSRWEAAQGVQTRVYTVGPTWQSYLTDVNQYLIQGQEGAALDDPATQLPRPPRPGSGLGFVFFPDEEQWLPTVRQLYPGGTDGEVRSHNGTHLFYTYVLTPAQAAAGDR